MQVMVIKNFEFEAAHWLPEYNGPCAQLHGHSYKLQVGVKGEVDSKTGMVIDFKLLKKKVNAVLVELDHRCLNDIDKVLEAFPSNCPTAERIARWLFYQLRGWKWPNKTAQVVLVRLWETADSYAEVSE